MKRSIARKWAKALESGEYAQGTGVLRTEVTNKFCCLGVLCNLHAQDNPDMAATQTEPHIYFEYDTELPDEVVDYSGMRNREGKFYDFIVKDYPQAHSLIDLNDEEELTFPEIAKIIRKHWKEL